ncbi:MAG: MBL fold metallo-hydrolase [Thermaerobacter sp.]|nr:MBL fold metallo-hydrolase [Thermaerobacter sp.]
MICERTVAENAWQVEEGLYRVLLPLPWSVPFVNAYVVKSDGQYMLVDCGVGTETSLRALGRALKAIGVPPRGLSLLLLTHRHPDHAGAARAVHEHWGGRVLLHGAARRTYPSSAEMLSWAVEEGLVGEALERLRRERREWPEPLPEGLEPLAGDTLRFGAVTFDVVHAPGHCSGQVLLHERNRGWLLSADQILTPLAANVWYQAQGEGDPLGEYLESLEATARIAADLVLPGHAAPWRGGPAQGAQQMLSFQRDYIERVAACVDAAPQTAWQVTERFAASQGGRATDASELAEVLAALVHLGETGRIQRTEERRWIRS